MCKSRKRDPYSMIYAYFNAVTKNETPRSIAEQTGQKMWNMSYGNHTGVTGEVEPDNKWWLIIYLTSFIKL